MNVVMDFDVVFFVSSLTLRRAESSNLHTHTHTFQVERLTERSRLSTLAVLGQGGREVRV